MEITMPMAMACMPEVPANLALNSWVLVLLFRPRQILLFVVEVALWKSIEQGRVFCSSKDWWEGMVLFQGFNREQPGSKLLDAVRDRMLLVNFFHRMGCLILFKGTLVQSLYKNNLFLVAK